MTTWLFAGTEKKRGSVEIAVRLPLFQQSTRSKRKQRAIVRTMMVSTCPQRPEGLPVRYRTNACDDRYKL